MQRYFSTLTTQKYDYVRNPFTPVTSWDVFTLPEQRFASISTDRIANIKQTALFLYTFWISVREHSEISTKALVVFIRFSSSYLRDVFLTSPINKYERGLVKTQPS
jgi:hypothetical protein